MRELSIDSVSHDYKQIPRPLTHYARSSAIACGLRSAKVRGKKYRRFEPIEFLQSAYRCFNEYVLIEM